ncbi:ectonucleoside triphosphate diphosphohydrolase 1 isoform X1 [Polypterus senegalus]|uniref:ectonucleoside triphosphate diphosphohydrolase 1 isoform X1 n=1 Tax=Polypterus senegalus TaxID=55291 RepID=UPI0019664CDE|nr:ectonucleoside triphosphate diphosphohydrolase 1 isoform X1 [Polypterus senegalus]
MPMMKEKELKLYWHDIHDMQQKNPWHRKLIVILAILFIVGIVAIVTTAVLQNKPLPQKMKYGIVLDAGSSHTSLYIYKWPAEKENDTGVVQQHHACNVKGPGISSYSAKTDNAGKSLTECMDLAKTSIPEIRHSETPVYLGATAGMRLLREQDYLASENVLISVANTLRSYPFKYEGARIITGQEEGAYGWITVNYLQGNFQKNSRFFDPFQETPASVTLGALDLGGASTQITFVPQEEIESEENSLHFRLYGKDYNVYTHSFLCYGKDQALNLTVATNLKTDEPDNVQENPCFHVGYSKTISLKNLYNSPCTAKLKKNLRMDSVSLSGTGNASKCRENVLKIFNFSVCTSSSCSFNGIYQPHIYGSFGAFSAYYFVMQFLNLTTYHETSLVKVKEKMEHFCSTPWASVKQRFPTVKEKYLSEYCFSGNYIITLLENGYSFNESSWNTIKFIKKIGNSDAGWTLGYMLNLTNMIPAEAPSSPPLPYGGYVAIMVIFSLLLLALCTIGYIFFGKPACNSQKHII